MFFTTISEFNNFLKKIRCLICRVNDIQNIIEQNELTTSTTTTTTTLGGEESRITEDTETRLTEDGDTRIIE